MRNEELYVEISAKFRPGGVRMSGVAPPATHSARNAAAGTHATTSRIYGTAVGADYRVSPNTLVGFALGGAGTDFCEIGHSVSPSALLIQGGAPPPSSYSRAIARNRKQRERGMR